MKFLGLLALTLLSMQAIATDCTQFKVKLKKVNGDVEFFEKINKAVKASNNGDKIVLGSYSFNENVRFNNKDSIVLTSRCQSTFKSLRINYSKDIKIKNIIIDANQEVNATVNIQGNSENIKFKNVTIKNGNNDGLRVGTSVKRVIVVSSRISNNSGNGINISKQNSDRHAVRNSEISGNGKNGIILGDSKLKVLSTTITNNGLAGNNRQGYGLKRDANSSTKPKQVKVINSTIINNNGKIETSSPFSSIDIDNIEYISDETDTGNTTTANTEFPTSEIKPVSIVENDKLITAGDSVTLDGTKSYNLTEGSLTYKWRIIEKPSSSIATIENDILPLTKFITDLTGTYKIGLIVTNGTANSVEEVIWITTVNTRPVAVLESSKTVSTTETVNIDASASFDQEQASLTYFWSIKDKPAGSTATITTSTNSASFVADVAGNYDIELYVSDGSLDSKKVLMTISTVNTVPVAIANESFDSTLGPELALNATASTDFDADTLSFEWSLLYSPEESMSEILDPAVNPTSFMADANGLYIFQVIVRDAVSSSTPYVFYMEVNNSAPTAEIVIGSPFIETSQLFQVDGSLSADLNNDPLTYKWTLTSKPSGSNTAISTTSSQFLDITPDVSGEYNIQLVVNDGFEDSSPVSVTLNSTFRPVANINGDSNIKVAQMLKLNSNGSTDTDGDSLSYNWSIKSKPTDSISPLGDFMKPEVKFIVDKAGSYEISLVAFDGKLYSTPVIKTVTATKFINTPPTLNDIPGQSIVLGSEKSFTITGNDTDGEYFFSLSPLPLPKGMKFNSRTGLIKYLPVRDDVGVKNYTVSINDGITAVSKTLVINVIAPPVGTPTSMSGRVLDTTSHVQGLTIPIVGATVLMKETNVTATTDSQGYFTLTNIPEPQGVFYIDTSTANNAPDGSKYANFGEGIVFVEGTDNVHERPFYIPRIDPAGETTYQQNTEVTLTNPNLGVSAVIPSTTAIMTPEGDLYNGVISISEVPLSVAPVALPETLRPGMLLTIQPAGVTFSDPLKITFDNDEGLAPGNEVDIYSVNVDTGMFEIVGTARVSSDGTKVETFEGGIRAATWHFKRPKSTKKKKKKKNKKIKKKKKCKNITETSSCGVRTTRCVGSSVDLKSGELEEFHEITSYQSFGKSQSLTLTYNSKSAASATTIDSNFIIELRSQVPEMVSNSVIINGISEGIEVFTDTSNFNEDIDESFVKKYILNLSNHETGLYNGSLRTTSHFPGSSFGNDEDIKIVNINLTNSPYGKGWGLESVFKLYKSPNNDLLIVDGDGAYSVYKYLDVTNEYESPNGEYEKVFIVNNYYVREFKNGTKEYFQLDSGNLVKRIDKNNNSVNYIYEESLLTEIIDEVGKKFYLEYQNRQLSSITDPAGRVTTLNISDGNLIEIEDPDGTSRKFDYDIYGQMTAQTSKSGNVNSYSYNSFFNLENAIKSNGSSTSTLPEDGVGAAERSGSCQGCSLMNLKGNRFNPELAVKEDEEFAKFLNQEGNLEKAKFNLEDDIIENISPLGRVHSVNRNEIGEIIEKIEPNGVSEDIDYDSQGNVVETRIKNTGQKTSTIYNSMNEVIQVESGDDDKIIYTRDQNGNIIKLTYSNGNFINLKYNNKGQIVQIQDTLNRITSFQYDKVSGNLVKQINPDATSTILTRDEAGNIISQTDENFNSTTTQYDEMNRPILRILADESETAFEYDSEGNISLLTDSRGRSSTFEFDSESRLINIIDPNGSEDTYIYGLSGDLEKSIDKLGRHTDYSYNEDGQITFKSRNNTNVSYTYLTKGNVHTIENNVLKTTYSYSLETGKVESVINESSHYPSNQTIYYDYSNTTGKLTSIYNQSNSYRANYSYGVQDQLTQINTFNGDVFFDYDRQQRRSKMRYIGGGVESIYNFDERDRLNSIKHNHNENTFHGIELTYDKTGNITSKVHNNNLQSTKELSYSYDEVNQITSETNVFSQGSTTFTWDQLGNRLNINDNQGDSSFDNFNRIIEDSNNLFFHDNNGNLGAQIDKATNAKVEFEFDDNNKLLRLLTIDPQGVQVKSVEYTYGPEDKRISKSINGVQTESYLYSGQNIIEVFRTTGNTKYFYTENIDEPVMMETNGVIYYLHADQLGSIIAITNKSGTLVEQYAYSAFGEMRIFDGSGVEIQNSQVGNIFGFTGREFDSESHLYYYRARYYDPSLGRFISADPIGFGGGDANLYRYVFNNALILKDPTGLSSYVGDMLDYLEDLRVRGLCKLKGKKCNGNDPIDMDDVPSDPDELERMMDDSNDSNESDESAKSCPLRRKNRA